MFILYDMSKKKKISHDEFEKRLKQIRPNVLLVSEYKGMKWNIRYICGNCKKESTVIAYNLFKKRTNKCSKCMYIRKTHKQFEKELKQIRPGVKLISKYESAKKNIKYICECGKENESKPWNILLSDKCIYCMNTIKKNRKVIVNYKNKAFEFNSINEFAKHFQFKQNVFTLEALKYYIKNQEHKQLERVGIKLISIEE